MACLVVDSASTVLVWSIIAGDRHKIVPKPRQDARLSSQIRPQGREFGIFNGTEKVQLAEDQVKLAATARSPGQQESATMRVLTLFCLGQFTVLLGQQPVAAFSTDKARALLAYLALEARPHRRAALAGLLWPDIGETYAAKNLRNTLHRLRQPLQAIDPSFTEQVLISTRQTIALDPAQLVSDVQRFAGLIRASTTHARSVPPVGAEHFAYCPACLARLTEAAELDQGELLPGFSIAGASAFEEWLVLRREELHQQRVWLFFELAGVHDARGEWELAQRYTRRLLALEPWREDVHCLLMRLLAQRGQRNAALAQYQQCRQVLRIEFDLEPAAETSALYEAIRSGNFDEATSGQDFGVSAGHPLGANDAKLKLVKNQPVSLSASPLVMTSPPHNLPAPLTPFVGRAHDLAQIGQRLQQGVRLLTLVGIGGMGKTRLALEVGRQALATYPAGVVLVSLAPLQTPTAIAPTIVTALGISLQGGDPRTILCQFLQPRRLLLILDNFEHLLVDSTVGVDLVTALLQAAPGVQIIVTSREHLHLRSEQLYPVQPLTVAANAGLAEAATQEATQLFVQSAQLAQVNFQLTVANLAVVLRICQLVQGMPLGLELAAAQVGTLPLRAIADAIQQNAAFLATEWHDVPERQRSLRAVFAWSWQLLTPAEQRALRQMSIFQGGFELPAAQAVIDVPQPLLQRLWRKSLLQWQESRVSDGRGEGRYTQHELLRQFAAEALAEAPDEANGVAARHSAFYLHYVAAQERRLARNEPGLAAAVIQQELDNVRQAWAWAAEQGEYALLAASAYSLWQFYLLTGLQAEGVGAFHHAVEGVEKRQAAGRPGPILIREWQQLRSQLVGIKAHLLGTRGDYDEALLMAQQAITLGIAWGSRAGEILGRLLNLQVFYHRGQLAKIRVEAAQLWQRLTDQPAGAQPSEFEHDGAFAVQLYWGAAAKRDDNYNEARHHFHQAWQLCQRLGKLRGALHAQLNLANVERYANNYAMARQGYEQVLQLSRQLHYRWGEGVAQYELADVLRGQGEYSLALSMFDSALAILRAINEPLRELHAAADLSRLYSYLGDYPQAQALLEQAEKFTAATKVPDAHHNRWIAIAVFQYQTGHYAAALQAATRAQQIAEEDNSRHTMGISAIYRGYAWEALDEWNCAQAAYASAFDFFQQLAVVPLVAEAQAGLARVALAQGDLAVAQAQVEMLLPMLADCAYVGLDEPFAIHLTCYRVLAAADDERTNAVLQGGYTLLQQYAARLPANEQRRRFLENVVLHRELQQAYSLADIRTIEA